MPYIKGCMPSKHSLLLILFVCALVSLVITACVFVHGARGRDMMSVAVGDSEVRLGEFVDDGMGDFMDDSRVSNEGVSDGVVSSEEVSDSRVSNEEVSDSRVSSEEVSDGVVSSEGVSDGVVHPTIKESNEHSATVQGMEQGDRVVSGNGARCEGAVDGNNADQGNCCINRGGNEQILENEREVQPESASPSKLSLPNGRERTAHELSTQVGDVCSRGSAHHCPDDDRDVEFFSQISLYLINNISSINETIGTRNDVPMDIKKNFYERMDEVEEHLQRCMNEPAT